MELITKPDNYIVKINYKVLYRDEKTKREHLENCIEQQKNEINKLNTRLKSKEEELVKAKKQLLSFTNSQTAKHGYKEEDIICDDLKNPFVKNIFAPILGIDYDECIRIKSNNKCDIQSKNNILNGQVKKYKKGQFQQLDRHWIDDLIESIPELNVVSQIFKDLFEYPLLPNGTHVDKNETLKKLCQPDYPQETLTNFLTLLNKHKRLILNYAFIGKNPEKSPKYLFGVEYINDKRTKIVLFNIKKIIDYLDKLEFKISPKKTGLILGNSRVISLQRKGGDSGKKSSNQLQFKIIISKLIDNVDNIQYQL